MRVVEFGDAVRRQVSRAVVGQQAAVDMSLIALLANGHVLLEGLPGLAKTLMVRSLAAALDLQFGRIQFTPDLMPSDVTGSSVFDQRTTEFKFRQGPIFCGILLADEINRTTPKTQSALLQAMEEREVTVDGQTYDLPSPFLVFATQNPIDFEGTYPLPEAQQDRFLIKVVLGYPEADDERDVLRRHHQGFRATELEQVGIEPVVSSTAGATGGDSLASLRAEVNAVSVEDKMFDYIYGLVSATRSNRQILIGGSPRASIALLGTAKAMAALRGRDFVIPDDVKSMALPVFRHRVILRPEAEVEGIGIDTVLTSVIDAQTVPR
ncbi:MAG: MoxR family ATPase [Fimbriimonadaceae bacterium]|nr:MoxR family ATPase [Fimbriimonadaceae bacterium]